MEERVSEERQTSDFKHVTPLNLRLDVTASPQQAVPVAACSCDHCTHTDTCGAEVDIEIPVDACVVGWG